MNSSSLVRPCEDASGDSQAESLAIGIGSTTAVFSVINGIVLRPLPYPDQNRLVALSNVYANRPEHSALVSGTDVAHWKVDNQVFENLDFVSHPDIVAMSSAGSGERVACST